MSESLKSEEEITLKNDNSLGKTGTDTKPASEHAKKTWIILGVVLIVAVIAFALLHKSEFERIEDDTLEIVGMLNSGDNYFTVDTYPESYKNMSENFLKNHQKKALEAIEYANKELGFSVSLYEKMLKTTALMGIQTEENDKYRVSWSYHPDEGLEVTYEKK